MTLQKKDLGDGSMIRRYLLAGLFTLLPAAVTFWVLRAIFDALVGIFEGPTNLLSKTLGMPTPPYWELAVASGAATLLLLFLVGALMGNFVGVQLRSWLDEVVMHIPVVKGIYGATKQLMSAIQSGQGGSFKDVVMVEWPQPGSYTLGFVAHRDCSWASLPGTEALTAVYIPTSPNPTSGYVVMLDKSKIRAMNVTPEEALTWAISGGVVAPLGNNNGPRP
jgi:uncharacterized membrane protein